MNTLSKRSSHRSITQSQIATERCAVENLIATLPDNWQQDILEVRQTRRDEIQYGDIGNMRQTFFRNVRYDPSMP